MKSSQLCVVVTKKCSTTSSPLQLGAAHATYPPRERWLSDGAQRETVAGDGDDGLFRDGLPSTFPHRRGGDADYALVAERRRSRRDSAEMMAR